MQELYEKFCIAHSIQIHPQIVALIAKESTGLVLSDQQNNVEDHPCFDEQVLGASYALSCNLNNLLRLQVSNASLSFDHMSSFLWGMNANTHIQELQLNSCAIEDQSVIALSLWLSSNIPLRKLSLSSNEKQTSLESIDISGNPYTLGSVEKIMTGLLQNRSVKHLNMQGIRIAQIHVHLLIGVISTNSTLISISLTLPQDSTEDPRIRKGIEDALLQNSSIQYLSCGIELTERSVLCLKANAVILNKGESDIAEILQRILITSSDTEQYAVIQGIFKQIIEYKLARMQNNTQRNSAQNSQIISSQDYQCLYGSKLSQSTVSQSLRSQNTQANIPAATSANVTVPTSRLQTYSSLSSASIHHRPNLSVSMYPHQNNTTPNGKYSNRQDQGESTDQKQGKQSINALAQSAQSQYNFEQYMQKSNPNINSTKESKIFLSEGNTFFQERSNQQRLPHQQVNQNFEMSISNTNFEEQVTTSQSKNRIKLISGELSKSTTPQDYQQLESLKVYVDQSVNRAVRDMCGRIDVQNSNISQLQNEFETLKRIVDLELQNGSNSFNISNSNNQILQSRKGKSIDFLSRDTSARASIISRREFDRYDQASQRMTTDKSEGNEELKSFDKIREFQRKIETASKENNSQSQKRETYSESQLLQQQKQQHNILQSHHESQRSISRNSSRQFAEQPRMESTQGNFAMIQNHIDDQIERIPGISSVLQDVTNVRRRIHQQQQQQKQQCKLKEQSSPEAVLKLRDLMMAPQPTMTIDGGESSYESNKNSLPVSEIGRQIWNHELWYNSRENFNYEEPSFLSSADRGGQNISSAIKSAQKKRVINNAQSIQNYYGKLSNRAAVVGPSEELLEELRRRGVHLN